MQRHDRMTADDPPAGRLARALPALALAILIMSIYSTGLHPGASRGDSAELQAAAALGGICHPPGYQTEVTLGGLFTRLPAGPGPAWRMNLLMALCGVLGCLVMYATVIRITGRQLAAIVAASILAFSVTWWTFSLVAEAYVFYALFLLLGLYFAVRFVQSDRAVWLYLAAAALGVGIGDRPSELPVIAGFVGLWFCFRRNLTLGPRRLVSSAILFVLPFAVSVGSVIVRSDPQRLAVRDDFHAEAILGAAGSERIRIGVDPDAPLSAKTAEAVDYCLGLVWARDSGGKVTLPRAWESLEKYAWLHSGAGARGLAWFPGDGPEPELRGGTSVGPLGLLLALLATLRWRRRPGWLLAGWGFVRANLAFVVLYYRWDNMTFTIPGAVGWSLLAGLGAAGGPETRPAPRRRLLLGAVALAAPVFLLATNAGFASQRTGPEMAGWRWRVQVAAAPWPERSAVVTTYWSAMTLRYMLHVEANRPDIRIINANRADWPRLIEGLNAGGHIVFIPRVYARASDLPVFLKDTPPPLAGLGFVRVVEVPGN